MAYVQRVGQWNKPKQTCESRPNLCAVVHGMKGTSISLALRAAAARACCRVYKWAATLPHLSLMALHMYT